MESPQPTLPHFDSQPTPAAPSVDIEQWPWAVKVYTLGRFAVVLANDNTLSCSGKTQKRPLELLKVLIAHGGRGVEIASVIDLLWAESDGDNGEASLHTTLHRLRKLLNCKDAVLLRDGRLSLDARYVWLDIWAFERLAGRLDTALHEARESEITHHTRQLCHLYREPFLKGLCAPWIEARRERLHSHFMRTLRMTGNYRERQGQWLEAIDLYQRGMELDCTSEEICQRLMIAYRQLGCYGEALAVYRRCSTALQTTFGINPSPETEVVRKSLRMV